MQSHRGAAQAALRERAAKRSRPQGPGGLFGRTAAVATTMLLGAIMWAEPASAPALAQGVAHGGQDILAAIERNEATAPRGSADADILSFLELPDLPQPTALAPLLSKPRAQDVVQVGPRRVDRWKVETLLRAAAMTDVDPAYLLALADKESSFSPVAKASTSSAEGMFQFIDKTWLKMLREFGPRYGLEAEAAMIVLVNDNPYVIDEGLRRQLLDLRRDAWLSALMAGELVRKDRRIVAPRIGRDLRPAESYLCHFLGPEDAGKFMALLDSDPSKTAASHFPAPAKANYDLFYVKESYIETVTKTVGKGKKKRKIIEEHLRTRIRGFSVAEVYQKFAAMIDRRIGQFVPLVRDREAAAGS